MQIATETVNRKIAIGLVGYESKKEIARCLDPWVGHVDTFICGDGKYSFYDAPNDFSEDGWLDFAEKRYKDKVEFIGYQYAGDQLAKRQMYLDLAGKAKCDFLIAVDTDEYLHPFHQDWNYFYKMLVKLSEIVPDRLFHQWVWIPDETLWPKGGNMFPSNVWRRSMKIHKDPGNTRFCCNSHYRWSSKDVSDDEIYGWQARAETDRMLNGEENPYLFACRNVIEGVRVTTDRKLRTPEQIKKGADWAFMNQHEELFREYCDTRKASKWKPPEGFSSWDDYKNAPHSFNKETGKLIQFQI